MTRPSPATPSNASPRDRLARDDVIGLLVIARVDLFRWNKSFDLNGVSILRAHDDWRSIFFGLVINLFGLRLLDRHKPGPRSLGFLAEDLNKRGGVRLRTRLAGLLDFAVLNKKKLFSPTS